MTNSLSFPALGLSFELDRVAFRLPAFLGSMEIYWYGIIIAFAFLVAITYILSRAKTFGLDADRVFDVAFVTIILGIIGARLYYIVFAEPGYIKDIGDIFRTRDGGLAIYGGIIFGIIGILITTKIRDVKLLPMMDLTVGGVLLGQAIGRWGNFINIEAFGSNTSLPWGMTSPVITGYIAENQGKLMELGVMVDPLQPVHPTFLYESLWCLIGFAIIFFMTKRRKFDGQLTLTYLAWYGLGRFFIEGLRTDSLLLGEVRISQAVAAICVVGSVLVLAYVLFKIKKSGGEGFPQLYVNTEESALILAGEYYSKKGKSEKVAASVAEVEDAAEKVADSVAEVEDAAEKVADSVAEVEDAAEKVADSVAEVEDAAEKVADSVAEVEDAAEKVADSVADDKEKAKDQAEKTEEKDK